MASTGASKRQKAARERKSNQMSITYYPNKKEYYKGWIKHKMRWLIPYWIKTPIILQMSPDNQIAVEKIGYMFGWSWKSWKRVKLTGNIYKLVRKLPPPEEDGQRFPAPLKPENKIIYASEDFMPYEYEPYMNIDLKLHSRQ